MPFKIGDTHLPALEDNFVTCMHIPNRSNRFKQFQKAIHVASFGSPIYHFNKRTWTMREVLTVGDSTEIPTD